jgi:hypothetical protein
MSNCEEEFEDTKEVITICNVAILGDRGFRMNVIFIYRLWSTGCLTTKPFVSQIIVILDSSAVERELSLESVTFLFTLDPFLSKYNVHTKTSISQYGDITYSEHSSDSQLSQIPNQNFIVVLDSELHSKAKDTYIETLFDLNQQSKGNYPLNQSHSYLHWIHFCLRLTHQPFYPPLQTNHDGLLQNIRHNHLIERYLFSP